MPTVSCRQCGAHIFIPRERDGAEWIIAHNRAQHSLHPAPLEFAEGRLMHEIMRDYAGHDDFGKKGIGVPGERL